MLAKILEPEAGMSDFGGEEARSSSAPSRMELNDQKAGMEGLDKEKINQIIVEASRGSKFYENEMRKEKETKARIEKLKERLDRLTVKERKRAMREVDKMIENREAVRDVSRSIVHVDMDMFYAAVEMRNDPTLRDKPVAVGGNAMLSTSNYIARRYGVRAAMPGFIAKKLCPDLKIVRPNFKEYTRVSRQARDVLAEYDPKFSAASLDEAYLDLTDYLKERQQGFHHYRQKTLHRKLDSTSNGGNDRENSSKVVDERETKCCRDSTGNLMRDGEKMGHYGNLSACVARGEHPEESMKSLWKKREIDLLDSSDSETEEIAIEESVEINSDNDPIETLNVPVKTPHIEDIIPLHGATKDTELSDQVSRQFGDSVEEVVAEIRWRIFQRTALTASAGIAPNRMLAKVCSDRNKPNGQFCLKGDREEVIMFVRSLPIRKICGVGKVSAQILNSIGITMCQQLYDQREILYLLFSPVSFQFFLDISLGIGSSSVDSGYDRKSMSTERTFSEISRPSELYEKCLQLCSDLANDLQQEGLKGQTVTIKLKLVTFEVRQRATSLSKAVNDPEEIFQAAVSSLQAEMKACHPEPLRLRLMGVKMSNFEHLEKGQTTIMRLFENKQEADEEEQKEASRFVCPVCLREQDFPVSSLASVNSHVDLCLSSQTAAKQVCADGKHPGKRRNSKPLGSVKKKTTLLSYWK